MNLTELIRSQTEDVYAWTNKLITSVPFAHWNTIPDVVESSICWQVGHLIMSHYYHSVMVVVGHQKDVFAKIPMTQYAQWFTDASPVVSFGKAEPSVLLDQLAFIQQKSLDVIATMTDEHLKSNLEPTHIEHPIAKVKQEALEWNINHTMYHCGQIGMIKRIVDVRYDFGLRREQKS